MKYIFLVSALIIVASVLPSSFANARVDAIYTVPMVNAELSRAAVFPTSSDQNIYGSPDKMGILRFALPEELTGVGTEFELTRRFDGTWDGTGTDGSKINGTCLRESNKWFTCTVSFDGLVIDPVLRDQILLERFGPGFELDQRSAVARSFEGQPLGIIKVRIGRY